MKYRELEKLLEKKEKKENKKLEKIKERNKTLITSYRTIIALNLGIIAFQIINQNIGKIIGIMLLTSSLIAIMNMFNVDEKKKITISDAVMLILTILAIYMIMLNIIF